MQGQNHLRFRRCTPPAGRPRAKRTRSQTNNERSPGERIASLPPPGSSFNEKMLPLNPVDRSLLASFLSDNEGEKVTSLPDSRCFECRLGRYEPPGLPW